MNSENTSLKQASFLSEPIASQPDLFPKPKRIVLNFKGTIPSFKNNKMLITKGPSGKPLQRPLLITKPEFQKVMAQIMAAFESQLLSAFQPSGELTLAASSIRSLIALSVPEDDCWEMIPEIHVTGVLCRPGEEGATITIERL